MSKKVFMTIALPACLASLAGGRPASARQPRVARASVALIAIKAPSIGIRVPERNPALAGPSRRAAAAAVDPDWSVEWNLPSRPQIIRVCIALTGMRGGVGESPARGQGMFSVIVAGRGRNMPLRETKCGSASGFEMPQIVVGTENHKYGSRSFHILLRLRARAGKNTSSDPSRCLDIVGQLTDGPAALQ